MLQVELPEGGEQVDGGYRDGVYKHRQRGARARGRQVRVEQHGPGDWGVHHGPAEQAAAGVSVLQLPRRFS